MAVVGSAQISPAMEAPPWVATKPGRLPRGVEAVAGDGLGFGDEAATEGGDLAVERQAGHVATDAE